LFRYLFIFSFHFIYIVEFPAVFPFEILLFFLFWFVFCYDVIIANVFGVAYFYPLEIRICIYRLSLHLCLHCPLLFSASLECFITFFERIWLIIFFNFFIRLAARYLNCLPFMFYFSDSNFCLYVKFIYVSVGFISVAY